MKKDDYKTNLEEERKEIDLPEGEEIQSRVELHSKSHKKSSRFSLANVLLIIFTLIPISILVFVFISLNFAKDPITPQAEEDGDEIQFETVGKSDEGIAMTDQEEKDKQEKEKEKKEKEKKEKEEKEKKEKEAREKEEAKKKEEEARKEEARQKEEARKQEEARQQELARQQAEKEKQQAEANKKQNENQSNQSGARTHTVAPGETLYRISVNYYGTGDGVHKLRQANGLSSNEISVGQKIVVP